MQDPKVQHWDAIYERPLENIPWEITEPPKELVELIKAKQITGDEALDIACGTGNYSLYLAQHGFRVTGIDFSEKALAIARDHAASHQLPVTFIAGDITKLGDILGGKQFDFILDYSILHHLDLGVTANYARQCAEALKPGGKLLLVCYSEKYESADVIRNNQSATGKYGNAMFFRTADEIRAAYKDLTEIFYHEARLGKGGKHPAHCFLFEKLIKS